MSIEELYQIYQQYPTVSTDSRKISTDCLFFALKGDNFNGNEYAQKAIAEGAVYAIIDEANYRDGASYILVEDVLTTLQQLATYHRQQFDIPLLAITGSNGTGGGPGSGPPGADYPQTYQFVVTAVNNNIIRISGGALGFPVL